MKKEDYIFQAKEILKNECLHFQGFEDLAQRLELNPAYFSRLFKKIEGQTPQAFLQDLRIEKAKILLMNTELSNQEIAMFTGFSYANYFAKVFKEKENLSPQAYRKKYRELKEEKGLEMLLDEQVWL